MKLLSRIPLLKVLDFYPDLNTMSNKSDADRLDLLDLKHLIVSSANCKILWFLNTLQIKVFKVEGHQSRKSGHEELRSFLKSFLKRKLISLELNYFSLSEVFSNATDFTFKLQAFEISSYGNASQKVSTNFNKFLIN